TTHTSSPLHCSTEVSSPSEPNVAAPSQYAVQVPPVVEESLIGRIHPRPTHIIGNRLARPATPPIVFEHDRLLGGIHHIAAGHPDQPVFGVPGEDPTAIVGQVAVRVVFEDLWSLG